MKNRNTPPKDKSDLTNKLCINGDLNSFVIMNKHENNLILSSESPDSSLKNHQNFLLKKKRKISDLNFTTESPIMKSKNCERIFSPFTTDSKITNYFPQKKNSSIKREYLQSSLIQKTFCETPNDDASFKQTEKNLSFAKKLNFDDFVMEKTSNSENLKNDFNLTNSHPNYIEHDKSWNCNNLHFTINQKVKETLQVEEVKEKVPRNSYQIKKSKNNLNLSKRTLKVLETFTKVKNKSKNLNLNLEKIIKKINKKTNSKNNSPTKKNSNLIQDIDKILNSYTIKEKYEELLNRELMLPCHYKSLLKKFSKLDEILNTSKINNNLNHSSENNSLSISKINSIFNKNFNLSFTQEELQQILYIVPHLFIYKWNESELIVDIPFDIKKRMDANYTEKTNFMNLQTFPYTILKTQMEKETLEKRFNFFKKILLHLTNEYHKKFIKERRIVTKLNPFKHRTWHSEFDVQGVPQIEMFKLIEKPKKKF